MTKLCESEIEKLAIEELVKLNYKYIPGPEIAPGMQNSERKSYEDVILVNRLVESIIRINPGKDYDIIEEAVRKLLHLESANLLLDNEKFHKFLTEGVPVEYLKDGETVGDYIKLFELDPEKISYNDFLVVNQFTIVENNENKRPDILIFINGIPLVIIELKNPADENATVRKAYNQIQTYKETIPSLFKFNYICVVSDGFEARAGSLTSPFSRFSRWKTKDGIQEAPKYDNELSTLISGMLNQNTLMDYIRNFITFEKTQIEDEENKAIQTTIVKKIAAYHQYYAVNKAIDRTLEAARTNGNKKAGVMWHTQGSGKSLTMAFYAGKLVQSLGNPTIVVITDRNDLDDQLFDTFVSSSDLLRQPPQQAESSEQLKNLLKVSSGGIIFTTIQKFFPDGDLSEFEMLSNRDNIIVMADEAHRTQYGFEAKLRNIKNDNGDIVGQRIAYGFAKYMRDALPNATYIGFTGTPVEGGDINTPAVFGNYIDIYDIAQAVEDKITVKIYYESRLAKVNLTEEGKRLIDEFDNELAEQSSMDKAKKAKMKWAKLESIVGNKERIANLANDIVKHFEGRQEVFKGKAMIVAMSRKIAVDLYDEIIKLRPHWHNSDLDKGVIKVVMTASSSDGPDMQKHHTTKGERKKLSKRMKDENDELKLVIVRDMWLTGFDAPSLHTMYIDKPMKGHNLMQAIARVNRVFKDKPGGLIVDYIGIGTSLKKALDFYAESGGKGMPAETQEKAAEFLLEKLEVVRQMLNGFDYSSFFSNNVQDKLSIILRAEDFLLGIRRGKERFIKEVGLLSKAYVLAKPHKVTLENSDEIAFFQAVKARLSKFEDNEDIEDSGYESVIKNLVDGALYSDKVIDIFDAAGMKKPEISILSDEFLSEIQRMKHKNLALELLKKLLSDEIKIRTKQNITKSKSLMELLNGSLKKYQNNIMTTAEIIDELINLAKEINAERNRGVDLGLNEGELAFYDALEVNDSAVLILGDETLKEIAKELAAKVRANTSIDWTLKESVRARLMVLVRRTLNKFGYPPDKQEKAIQTVMKQAENLADMLTQNE